jgi:S1-C subfamily serine protease
MYVIINIGECCHYQIEGGIFTEESLANNFVNDLVKFGRYERGNLKVTLVPVNPTVAEARLCPILKRPITDIWPKK